ncbi:hypothetical protein B296_00038446 [Ensete ventricosum]|uniref:Uncharacterized protein n=1 Tax=Ensete ventricosum TaxID=4639 RepID=A0A426X739_ENSVE|nr:hypothetical protein B296_00038446 [Ensete ventricosum]
MIGATGELDYFSTYIRLRKPDKSEDKAEGGTSVESSIPCSHGGRALVVKGAEGVENAEANSKYQDRAEGQMPRNFIRSIFRSRRKGCRCKATDSSAMGLAAPWYHRGKTFMESSIPCSHRRRALVVKGAKEVEYAKANSKYQDRADGQRPRNFIRPPSNLTFSTTKIMGEVKYPGSLTYPAEELCISSVIIQRKLMEDNSCQILTIGDQYY